MIIVLIGLAAVAFLIWMFVKLMSSAAKDVNSGLDKLNAAMKKSEANRVVHPKSIRARLNAKKAA